MPDPVTPTATVPDYALEPTLDVATPEQLKAIGDETRRTILSLLSERAATTSQLAEAFGKPRGSVGHHLKVLERAGLVRVVRRRKVRALTEKYYGRTARTFLIKGDVGGGQVPMLDQAMREFVPPLTEDKAGVMFTIRHARVPLEKIEAFARRVQALAEDFAAQDPGGDTTYGFVAGVYPTDLPQLGPAEKVQA